MILSANKRVKITPLSPGERVVHNIGEAMRYRGIRSQSELAKRSGLSQSFINSLMNSTTSISIVRLEKIADCLELHCWQLLLAPEGFHAALYDELTDTMSAIVSLDKKQRKAIFDIVHTLSEKIEE